MKSHIFGITIILGVLSKHKLYKKGRMLTNPDSNPRLAVSDPTAQISPKCDTWKVISANSSHTRLLELLMVHEGEKFCCGENLSHDKMWTIDTHISPTLDQKVDSIPACFGWTIEKHSKTM